MKKVLFVLPLCLLMFSCGDSLPGKVKSNLRFLNEAIEQSNKSDSIIWNLTNAEIEKMDYYNSREFVQNNYYWMYREGIDKLWKKHLMYIRINYPDLEKDPRVWDTIPSYVKSNNIDTIDFQRKSDLVKNKISKYK